jgi:hypothetical protein
MASLFKPTYSKPLPENPVIENRPVKGKPGRRPFVRVILDGKPAWQPLTKKGDRYLEPSEKWYGQYKYADGCTRRVPLSTDKTAAQQMLNALVRKAELGKVGIVDPFEEHARRPLADHLDDFRRSLVNKGSSERHAQQTVRRARRAIEGYGFVFIRDVAASRVQEWLADLRRADDIGLQTLNYYLRDVKSFTRWPDIPHWVIRCSRP